MSNGFCSHLHNFILFLLKFQTPLGNELNFICYFITQRPNIFLKILFPRLGETKNISDKIKNSIQLEKKYFGKNYLDVG